MANGKTCIYPGCERPAVSPNQLGGPQPSFCDLDEHNALSAHQERRRLESKETNRAQPAEPAASPNKPDEEEQKSG